MSNKVVIIGIDGATFNIITPMIEKGKLPNLARIMKEGTYGELESTVPPITPAAWTSFLTGKYPDKHGVFNFYHHFFNPASANELKVVNSSSIKARAMWNILEQYGKKMVFLNVPITYPTPKVDGIIISGLLTPPDRSDYVYPPEWKETIDELVGGYRLDTNPADNPRTRQANFKEGISELFDIEEKRKTITKYLLKEYPWDFFMVVFSITDKMSHNFWNQFENRDDASDLISRAYILSDRILGEILEDIDRKTSVIIMSDHGFGSVRGLFFTNRWLLDNGYLSPLRVNLNNFLKLYRMEYQLLSLSRVLRRVGLSRLDGIIQSDWMDKWFSMPVFRRRATASVVDWSRTRAYGANYGIYINRKGREPYGIVEGERDYELLRDEIIQRLSRLKDPETGEAILDYAVRREDMFSGPYKDEAPDIVFMVRNMSYMINNRYLFKKALTLIPKKGNHRMEGIFMARGENIRKGYRLKGSRIVDILPTALYMLDLPIPDDLDGAVLNECIHDEYYLNNPPNYNKTSEMEGQFYEDLLTRGEKDEIRSLLSNLGYLD